MTHNRKPTGLLSILRQRQQESFIGRSQLITLFEENLQRLPDHPQRVFIFNVCGQGGVGKTTLLHYFRRLAQKENALVAYVDETLPNAPSVLAHFAIQLREQGYGMPAFEDRYHAFQSSQQKLESKSQAPPTSLIDDLFFSRQWAKQTGSNIWPTLLSLLATNFNAGEINELCFELNISYEDLGESGHRNKVRELITYCTRHGRLPQLVIKAKEKRPHIEWPPVTSTSATDRQTNLGHLRLEIEWDPLIQHKFNDSSHVNVLGDPIRDLTSTFLTDLQGITSQKEVVLMCDTYEQTSLYLDSWWRALLNGEYGDNIPDNIIIILAGRESLDYDQWSPFNSIIAHCPVEPFSEAEARAYLIQHGIQNEEVVQAILGISGRLPLLVATLASSQPQSLTDLAEPSDTAVTRFLKWIDDPVRRQLAIDAALPQRVSAELLLPLLGEETNSRLQWLQSMPFVNKHADGWLYYHNVVRSQMLRYKLSQDPANWSNLHQQLANVHAQRRDALRLDFKEGVKNETWQTETLANLYHHLCRQPHHHLPKAIQGFIDALNASRTFALRWAETMAAAGKDRLDTTITSWAENLRLILNTHEEREYKRAIHVYDDLLTTWQLTAKQKATLLSRKGEAYLHLKQYENAVTALTQAITISPDDKWAFAQRGIVNRERKEFEAAIADLSQAIEIVPQYTWALVNRGLTYELTKNYKAAIDDFSKAIEIDPRNAWALAQRGLIYAKLRQYEDAIEDLGNAIILTPENAWILAKRGMIYQEMKQYETAVMDLSRVYELNPDYTWALAIRRQIYRSMNQHGLAISELTREIDNNPTDAHALAERGITYGEIGRHEFALTDLSQAIKIAPDNTWALANRGVVYAQIGQFEDAIHDLTRTIELDPTYAWALTIRGKVFKLIERYEDAVNDFSQAIKLDPEDKEVFAQRGAVYRLLGQDDAAIADLSQAIELDPLYTDALVERGITYLQMEQYEPATEDFTQSIKIDPEDKVAFANRGLTYRLMEQAENAVHDLTQVLRLDPENKESLLERGIAHRLMKQYKEALADLSQALKIDPKHARVLANRALVYQLVGEPSEALNDYNQAIQLDFCYPWVLAGRGKSFRLMGQYQEAINDFNQALETDPLYKEALIERGITYRLRKQFEQAVNSFKQALELDPQHTPALANLAITQRLTGLHEAAITNLNQIIDIDSKDTWVFTELGINYRQIGQYEAAITSFNHAQKLDPGYTWALYNRAVTYHALNLHEASITDLGLAAFDLGSLWTSTDQRGNFQLMSLYKATMIALSRTIDHDPEYVVATFKQEQASQEPKPHDDALVLLNSFIQIDPEGEWGWAIRGTYHQLMGQYEASVADLSRSIDLNPTYVWALAERGTSYRFINQYEKSIQDYNRVVNLNPEYAWAWAERGTAFRLIERYEEAITDFSRAIELDLQFAFALAERGQAYKITKRYAEAIQDLTWAIEIDPQYAWALGQRGETYLLQDKYDVALADLVQCLDLNPKSDWTWYLVSLLYDYFDKKTDAAASIEQAINLAQSEYEKNSEAWQNTLNLALYYLAAGQQDKAEHLYEESLSAPVSYLQDALQIDLHIFLHFFPNHAQALTIRNLLRNALCKPG